MSQGNAAEAVSCLFVLVSEMVEEGLGRPPEDAGSGNANNENPLQK